MVLPLPVASRQVCRLAPFQRFRQRTDAFNGCCGLKDEIPHLEKPRANALGEGGERCAPHRPASGAVVCPLRRLQRQMDVGQEVGRPHKLWIVEIGLEYWSVVWLVA